MHTTVKTNFYGVLDVEITSARDRRMGIERRSAGMFARLFSREFAETRKQTRRGILGFSIERQPGFLEVKIYDYTPATLRQVGVFLAGLEDRRLSPPPVLEAREFEGLFP